VALPIPEVDFTEELLLVYCAAEPIGLQIGIGYFKRVLGKLLPWAKGKDLPRKKT